MKPKKCAICNDEFIPRTSLQKYCSPKCGYEARLRNDRKNIKPKECPICNDQFKPYHGLQKFCSYKCQVKNKKNNRSGGRKYSNKDVGRISGKNNPAYRNGSRINGKDSRKKEREFKRNAKNLKSIMIYNIGYLYCESCKTNRSLRFEAHHIIYRSEKPNHLFIHHKKNILILCIQCHNDWHKTKGLRNDIVEQRKLHEYFGNDILNK